MRSRAQIQRETEHTLDQFIQDFFSFYCLNVADKKVSHELECINRVVRPKLLDNPAECLCCHQPYTLIKQVREYKPYCRIEELQRLHQLAVSVVKQLHCHPNCLLVRREVAAAHNELYEVPVTNITCSPNAAGHRLNRKQTNFL